MTNKQTPHIALVVGAGGPTGGPFIHAALDVLRAQTSWDPASATTVVGTSAGAFVAASIDPPRGSASTTDVDTLRTLANLEQFRSKLTDRFATTVRHLIGRMLAVAAPTGRPFAEYQVSAAPYHPGAKAVTVRRGRGTRVLHDLAAHGDAEAVVRASAAIPFLNRPVDVLGELHVDGAVHSAANVDAVDVADHDALVVIAPMIASSGGSIVTRFHRAQLRHQLRPWATSSKPVVVIVPNEVEHSDRRNVDTFRPAGSAAAHRLWET